MQCACRVQRWCARARAGGGAEGLVPVPAVMRVQLGYRRCRSTVSTQSRGKEREGLPGGGGAHPVAESGRSAKVMFDDDERRE